MCATRESGSECAARVTQEHSAGTAAGACGGELIVYR